MITEEILRKFESIKDFLAPGERCGNFFLSRNGVYAYRHENGLFEIIDFTDAEAEERYYNKCIATHNKYFK